jgi:hypothetical protein
MAFLRFVFVTCVLGSCTNDFDSFDPADALASDGSPDVAQSKDSAPPQDATTDVGADGLDAGLVAYYKFDETGGTTCADSSGNGQTATLVGNASFSPGVSNNALLLSGSGQYAVLPTGIVNGLTSCSISVWVNLISTTTWNRVFDFGTGTNAYWALTPKSSYQTLRSLISIAGTSQEQDVDTPTFGINAWHHIVVTLDGTIGTLFFDGSQVAQGAVTLTPASLGQTNQNWLGRSQFASDPYLNGQLDNFRIYSRVLSGNEVSELFTARE